MHVRSYTEISLYLCFRAISTVGLHKRFFAQRMGLYLFPLHTAPPAARIFDKEFIVQFYG